MSTEDLVTIMANVCEEYWNTFVQRCKVSGFTEEEAEEALDSLREE